MDEVKRITITLTFEDGTYSRRMLDPQNLDYFWSMQLSELFELRSALLKDLSSVGMEAK